MTHISLHKALVQMRTSGDGSITCVMTSTAGLGGKRGNLKILRVDLFESKPDPGVNSDLS